MNSKILLISVIIIMTGCNKTRKTPQKEVNVPAANTIIGGDTTRLQPDEDLPIQLIIKHELTEKDLYTDYDGGNQLADYFLIELIDKNTFNKNKSIAVSMLSADTTVIRKQKGVLRLPCNKRNISFVDNLSETKSHKEYNYIGQIQYLNAYVLSGIYWEDWNYFLVDKATGSTVQTFTNCPHLSTDGKYIISLDFDIFEGTTYIDLYAVTDQKYIDPLVGMYVKKWIPIDVSQSIYWGKDNFLYIPVIHNQDYWAADGNFSGLDQYIRLKPIVS